MNVQISQEEFNTLLNLSSIMTRNRERIDYFEARAIELRKEFDIANARYEGLYKKICEEKRLDPKQQHNFTVASTNTSIAQFVNNDGDPTQS